MESEIKRPDQLIPSLTDQELREAIFEILEDEKRDDGIIKSEWNRALTKKWSEMTGQPSFLFLSMVPLLLYKEACKRFLFNN